MSLKRTQSIDLCEALYFLHLYFCLYLTLNVLWFEAIRAESYYSVIFKVKMSYLKIEYLLFSNVLNILENLFPTLLKNFSSYILFHMLFKESEMHKIHLIMFIYRYIRWHTRIIIVLIKYFSSFYCYLKKWRCEWSNNNNIYRCGDCWYR